MPIEIFTIVRDPETGFLCFHLERMGQTQIAKLEVVSVRLAISRHVYQIS